MNTESRRTLALNLERISTVAHYISAGFMAATLLFAYTTMHAGAGQISPVVAFWAPFIVMTVAAVLGIAARMFQPEETTPELRDAK